MTRRLAYLGPPGTFTEEAALRYAPQAQFLPFTSVSAVAAAVDSGMADEGVVAIENSLEGSVPETLDILIHESQLRIRRELVLPVEHCLLVQQGTAADQVEVIYSHPHALGQCRRFVERCFPKARVEAAMSTAAAVADLAGDPRAAAIGTARAAELYGVQVLARAIQDQRANETRFVVLAPEDHPPTGHDKTSLAFSVSEAQDRPGALVAVLREFSDREINLTRVESRPSKESLGKYIFLVDLEGHREDPHVADALAAVRTQASLFKVFGSYPRWDPSQA